LEKDEKGGSEYSVNKTVFRNFKSEVPDEVQKALNFGDLNIQSQLDQHFLITSPPGEVARVINNVIRIEQVDEWVAETTSRINRANSEIRILESQTEQTQKKLHSFEYLPELEKTLEALEKIWSCLDAKQKAFDKLFTLTNSMYLCKKNADNARLYLKREKIVEEAEELLKKLREASYVVGNIINLRNASYSKAEIEEAVSNVEALVVEGEGILLQRKEKEKEAITIEAVYNAIKVTGSLKAQATTSFQNAKGAFILLLKTLKKCPTCYAPIGSEAVSRIEEEIL
jgi:hypothetical protein